MSDRFDRTIALIGKDGLNRLRMSHIVVIGLGGVGGAVVEVIARCGVGRLTLIDGDAFEPSNLNRQILCATSEVGKNKADVAAERVCSIDDSIAVTPVTTFVTPENIEGLLSSDRIDYVIDAIDDIRAKTAVIMYCKANGIPIVSAMGAGNRLSCDFVVTDIYKTEYDPVAKLVRRELRNNGVRSLDVVCATSAPSVKSATPASIAAPPMVMGAMLANFAVGKILSR